METVVFFAAVACFLCAGVTYVVMDYRFHGERQGAMESVLNIQAEAGSAKKKLLGYTKFMDYMPTSKQSLSEKMKHLVAKVSREYVYVENIRKETLKRDTNASVIVRYSVEFTFGFDVKPDGFEILGAPGVIEIQIKRPTLITTPVIKSSSHEIPSGVAPFDEKETVAEIRRKLPEFALQHGAIMSSEESVRALCEKKLIEYLRNFLVSQPGVVQVPGISIVYK